MSFAPFGFRILAPMFCALSYRSRSPPAILYIAVDQSKNNPTSVQLVEFGHPETTNKWRQKTMTSEATIVDVSRDWVIACGVQARFMQTTDRPRTLDILDYSAHCRQLQALGGDCYEFAQHGNSLLALTIGDASGKGLAAALMIANVQSSLRTASAFAADDLVRVLGAVNRQVHASSLEERYATLFHGLFHPATRTLRYVNAGHNPPMIIRRDGSIIWLQTGGAPVGLFQDSSFEEGVVSLKRGDLVLAYTDGVIEAVNPAGDEWGIDGLRNAAVRSAAQSADEIVHAIFASMDEFTRGYQTDDATVLVLRVD
jgi:sigma-B regulation protein RsbU (phosphoserine phosphatase)